MKWSAKPATQLYFFVVNRTARSPVCPQPQQQEHFSAHLYHSPFYLVPPDLHQVNQNQKYALGTEQHSVNERPHPPDERHRWGTGGDGATAEASRTCRSTRTEQRGHRSAPNLTPQTTVRPSCRAGERGTVLGCAPCQAEGLPNAHHGRTFPISYLPIHRLPVSCSYTSMAQSSSGLRQGWKIKTTSRPHKMTMTHFTSIPITMHTSIPRESKGIYFRLFPVAYKSVILSDEISNPFSHQIMYLYLIQNLQKYFSGRHLFISSSSMTFNKSWFSLEGHFVVSIVTHSSVFEKTRSTTGDTSHL